MDPTALPSDVLGLLEWLDSVRAGIEHGGFEALVRGLCVENSALRNAVQAYPVVPLLKALVAHYRDDAGWAELRPPFEALDAATSKKAIDELAANHGLKLEIDDAD